MKHLLIGVIVAMATAPAAASGEKMTPLSEARRIALALERELDAASSHAKTVDALRAVLHDSMQRRVALRIDRDDALLAGKIAQWQQIEAQLAAAIDARAHDRAIVRTGPVLPRQANIFSLNGDAPGTACERAIPLQRDQRIDIRLDTGGSAWITVPADRNVFAITTRGSSVDAKLMTWDDCRETARPAVREVDDAYGLQADLAFLPAKHSRRVRVDNPGERGVVALSLVGATAITGAVTDEATGAGLQGIGVQYHLGSTLEFTSYGGSAQSAIDGTYFLPVFTAGSGFVRTGEFSVAETLHEMWPNRPCAGSNAQDLRDCGPVIPPFIVTTEGNVTSGIDFALGRGASLFGRTVDDATGVGIANSTVTIRDTAFGTERQRTTDAAGRFVVRGLRDGQVRLRAFGSEHAPELYRDIPCEDGCEWASGTPVTVAATGTPTNVTMALSRRVYLDVNVTVDGVPLASFPYSAQVDLLNSNGFPLGAYYGSKGFVRAGPLQPGTYYVRAHVPDHSYKQLYDGIDCPDDCQPLLAQATPITITDTAMPQPIDMDLRGFPLVRGRIVDAVSAQPLDDVRVYLYNSTGVVSSRETDDGGNYQIPVVSPGTYTVAFVSETHLDELYDEVPCESTSPLADCAGATFFTVAAFGPDRIIDNALRRNASITGRYTYNGTATPIRALSLALVGADGHTVHEPRIEMRGAQTYVARDVPLGSWRIGGYDLVSRSQLFPATECGTGAGGSTQFVSCPANAGTVFSPTPGQTLTNIDFNLRGFGARRGRVVDELSGLPIVGVAIDLWDSGNARVATLASGSDGYFFADVGPGGPAGPYRLSSDNALGYRDEVYDDIGCAAGSVYLGTCTLAGAATISLPDDGSGTDIVFALIRDTVFGGGFE